MRSQPFWTLSVAQVLEEVAGSETGLTSAEAGARLKRWGPNELAPPRRFGAVREIVRFIANPLVLILLVASAVSAAFGQVVRSLIIALMVLLSIALNFTQAYRSQRAAQWLREQVVQTATVVRDGVPHELPAREVVPGDRIHLAAGDLVPADARLLAAKDLFLNEAALTGESLPQEKHAQPEGTSAESLDAATNAVFRGGSVVSGLGVALVAHTGTSTEFGRVAAQLSARPPDTEFERGTRRFGFLILEAVIFLALFVFLVNALFRRDPLESFLFAVALAVGLTPELLPMIVSVTLASGAVRMAKKKVIVKRLAAIENFGSMDILCSDKTGTLTVGKIAVEQLVNLRGREDEAVIRLAALNSTYQTGLRSPMDEAILRHVHPAWVPTNGWTRSRSISSGAASRWSSRMGANACSSRKERRRACCKHARVLRSRALQAHSTRPSGRRRIRSFAGSAPMAIASCRVVAGLHSAPPAFFRLPHGHDCGLSRARGGRERLVLPPLPCVTAAFRGERQWAVNLTGLAEASRCA